MMIFVALFCLLTPYFYHVNVSSKNRSSFDSRVGIGFKVMDTDVLVPMGSFPQSNAKSREDNFIGRNERYIFMLKRS